MINFAMPSGKWEKPSVAKTWEEGITVLVHRPKRNRLHNGYLEIDNYFRPDYIDKSVAFKGECIYFMKILTH